MIICGNLDIRNNVYNYNGASSFICIIDGIDGNQYYYDLNFKSETYMNLPCDFESLSMNSGCVGLWVDGKKVDGTMCETFSLCLTGFHSLYINHTTNGIWMKNGHVFLTIPNKEYTIIHY